jgi:glycosyltransferase involved in cell wall biosynthesis
MRHVKSPVDLRIAGTGPQESELREISKDDPRISFLGFVNDAQMVDLYADALAVLFVPYDEDYGLVTVEAMMSGKPVITAADSGGPNEFVRNGETGFSVEPDPKALADRIDYLCRHQDEARSMGLKGHDLVKNIRWNSTVAQLLGTAKMPAAYVSGRRRKKITVAVTFPVFPPRGGGQSRVFHLYRQIARDFDVDLVTFTNSGEQNFTAEIAEGVREVRIPKSAEHQRQEWETERLVSVPVGDMTMIQLYRLTPEYLDALRMSVAEADFVVASHPYLFDAIREVSDKPVWYEAHNVEIELKRHILPDNETGRSLLATTARIERECCEQSTLIMVCSHEDAEALKRLYAVDLSKVIEVPNGVDLETVHFVPPRIRSATKKRLGMEDNFTALFMGSWHGPNLDAARKIFRFAEHLPDVNFLIVGSACLALSEDKKPHNVGCMGVVDDETKDVILGVVDVALNPMESGSGTNLKMLDYCAAGIPVISTPHGARGLGLRNGDHIHIAEIDEFPGAIRAMRHRGEALAERIERARTLVASQYDWSVIARNFIDEAQKRNFLSEAGVKV